LLCDLGGVTYYPTVQGCMVNVDTPLNHDLLEVTIGNRISNVEESGMEDHTFGEMSSLEINRKPRSPHSTTSLSVT
jgi:hypothetical protein